jgi:hypothetical protein
MRRTVSALLVLGAIWVIGIAAVDDVTAVLFLAPAFILLLPLLAGRYPGETLIAGALRRAPAPRPRRVAPRLRPPARCAPSGGLLVAFALAGRGPPA